MNNPNENITSIPHRFREDQFRRYEHVLLAAIADWPTPVTAVPGDLSSVTFTNRLRDAKTSFLRYHWKSELNLADEGRVKAISVHEINGNIYVGDSTEIRKLTTPARVVGNASPSTQNVLSLNIPNDMCLRAIVTLLSFKVLAGPLQVTLTPSVTPDLLQDLEGSFDIVTEPVGNGVFLIT